MLTKLLMRQIVLHLDWTTEGVIRSTVGSCETRFPGDPKSHPNYIILYYHWANTQDLCKHVPVAEAAVQIK